MEYRDEGYLIRISEVNKILQKYRNSNLTYDLIREIVEDMNNRIINENSINSIGYYSIEYNSENDKK